MAAAHGTTVPPKMLADAAPAVKAQTADQKKAIAAMTKLAKTSSANLTPAQKKAAFLKSVATLKA